MLLYPFFLAAPNRNKQYHYRRSCRNHNIRKKSTPSNQFLPTKVPPPASGTVAVVKFQRSIDETVAQEPPATQKGVLPWTSTKA
jgi:hypothetical protein